MYCGSFWPSPSMVATMEPRAAQAPDNIVATLELDDGSTVQFLEPTPGLIAIHADVPLAGKKGAKPGVINGASEAQAEEAQPQSDADQIMSA